MIPIAVLFPAEGTEHGHCFGPYEIEVAKDAVPLGQDLPLIVVSHGNSSTPGCLGIWQSTWQSLGSQ